MLSQSSVSTFDCCFPHADFVLVILFSLKIEATCSFENRLTFALQHGFISQKILHFRSYIADMQFLIVWTKKKNSVASVRKRTIPTERPPLVSEVSANFADRGFHMVSVTNPYCRILDFLDRSRCYFFQVAPQLYSRGWVDPVSDTLLFFLVVPSGSLGRNSDH
jgi:hypothetical protein